MNNLLNYKEAAARLRVSPKTLQNWVQQGKIERVKLGNPKQKQGKVRFTVEALERFIKRHTIPAVEV